MRQGSLSETFAFTRTLVLRQPQVWRIAWWSSLLLLAAVVGASSSSNSFSSSSSSTGPPSFWGVRLDVGNVVSGGASSSSASNTLPRSQSKNSIPRSNNHHHHHLKRRRRGFFRSDEFYDDDPDHDNNADSSSNSNNNNDYDNDDTDHTLPPWNPSPHIDDAGFLAQAYARCPGDWEAEVRLRTFQVDTPCRVRQVPGDGNCLFHSISLCLHHALYRRHYTLFHTMMKNKQKQNKQDAKTNNKKNINHNTSTNNNRNRRNAKDEDATNYHRHQLYEQSHQLRCKAVACLRQSHRKLFLQGKEVLRANELVAAAAHQYQLTPEEYCDAMEQDCVWGGGPEIVALCNILQRPIHVYELATTDTISTELSGTTTDKNDGSSKEGPYHHHHNHPSKPRRKNEFVLRRMACFGSPRFDRKAPLHILSADSRFPDVRPGAQMASGNHFLAVFPVTPPSKRKAKKSSVRGGSGMGEGEYDRDHYVRHTNRSSPWENDNDDDNDNDDGLISENGDLFMDSESSIATAASAWWSRIYERVKGMFVAGAD